MGLLGAGSQSPGRWGGREWRGVEGCVPGSMTVLPIFHHSDTPCRLGNSLPPLHLWPHSYLWHCGSLLSGCSRPVCEMLGVPCVSALPTSRPRPAPCSISQTFALALPRCSDLKAHPWGISHVLWVFDLFFTLRSCVHLLQTRTTKFQSRFFLIITNSYFWLRAVSKLFVVDRGAETFFRPHSHQAGARAVVEADSRRVRFGQEWAPGF